MEDDLNYNPVFTEQQKKSWYDFVMNYPIQDDGFKRTWFFDRVVDKYCE